MYELIQAGEKSWYIKNPANVGVYSLGGGDICLIDSGNDKEAGRKILKKVTEEGWRVSCIINTHSNADHTGGNQFIQSRTGCRVLSTDIENTFARHPEQESSFLYGGYPYAELRNKFLLAKPTESTVNIEDALPGGLEIIKLPGHYFDMIGIKTDDGACFLADSLFSAEIIEKYHIVFIYDVAKFLETLDMLEGLEAKIFIPAHNEPLTDIRELIEVNRAKVHEIAALLCEICAAPKTFERILKEVFARYGLTMDHNQYVLVGSTIRSYLSWLHDGGRLNIEFIDNEMLWSRTDG
ncbi:MBL fold metallo-hydrolase [Cloacibacillus evryensis]|uniref:MBL fold metallo-hydrolase n=1 Tax=Cloacibacillus evryensis TaxID=508460 RepID=UPI00210DE43E|nr:MBL fold metallo-hydrolase [Cloacibacillus evryensis]MCQ4765053.1 MBL fold metallo-hydrolase [Cloacibacillus evryensis]